MKDRELSRFDFKATHHDAPEGSFYSFGTAWWPTLEVVTKNEPAQQPAYFDQSKFHFTTSSSG